MKKGSILYKGQVLPTFIHCGSKIYAPRELHVKRTFPSFNIQICEKGTIGINEDGIDYTINEGEYLIMTPELFHFGAFPQEKEAIVHFIHFMPGEGWTLALEKEVSTRNTFRITDNGLGIHCPTFEMSIPMGGNISHEQMRHIKKLITNYDNISYLKAQQMFLELLESIMGGATMSDEELLGQKRIYTYIKKHYLDTNFSIEQLAHIFGYSRQYITKLIKKDYGKSFSEIVMDLKVNYAKQQLAIGYISITELAYELGYNDVSAFSHMFLAKTGLRPSEYAKSVLEIER